MPFRTPLDLYKERITALDRRRLLRPLKTGEIIDHAVRLIQLYGLQILPRTVFPSTFVLLALVNYGIFVSPMIFGSRTEGIQGQVVEFAVAIAMFVMVCIPLFIIGVSYTLGLTSRLAQNYMMGNTDRFEDIEGTSKNSVPIVAATVGFAVFRSLFPTLICAGVMTLMAVLVGSFPDNILVSFIAVAIIFFGFIFAFLTPPIIMGNLALAQVAAELEGVKGKAALDRSRFLMKGQGHILGGHGSLFGSWFLVLFIVFCIYIGLESAFAMFGLTPWAAAQASQGQFAKIIGAVVQSLPGFLALWLVTPLYGALVSILYFDRRVRVEAYDIKVLANDVLQSNDSPPPAA